MLIVMGFTSIPSAAAAGVCETEVVHDYTKPLRALPALPQTTVNGGLSFGPAGLRLESRDPGPLVLPVGHDFRYTLSFRRHPGERPRLHLNWLATAKLTRLNRRGAVQQRLKWDGKRIDSLGSQRTVSLRVPASVKPGLYRLEVVFRDGANRRLGRIGEYVRALQPAGRSGRLTLNQTSFLPGETVTAEAEEPGIGWLEVNDVYSIETYDGSAWEPASISPKQPSLLIGTTIGPGEGTSNARFNPNAPCLGFKIPSGAPPGLYRLAVGADSLTHTDHRLLPGTRFALTAEFQILTASP